MRQRVLGDDHPRVLESRLEKARVLESKGDLDLARETMIGLYSGLASSLGSEHPIAQEALELDGKLRAQGSES